MTAGDSTTPSRPSLRPRRLGRSGTGRYLCSTSTRPCAFAPARPTLRHFDNPHLNLLRGTPLKSFATISARPSDRMSWLLRCMSPGNGSSSLTSPAMQPGLSEQKFARHSRPMIWMPSGSMRNSIFAACRIGSSAALSPASSILRSAFPVWDGAMPQASKSNEEDAMFKMLSANRRDLLIAPLLATPPGALLGDRADASPIDPNMTLTKLPDQIIWEAARNRPPNTVEQALLWGRP